MATKAISRISLSRSFSIFFNNAAKVEFPVGSISHQKCFKNFISTPCMLAKYNQERSFRSSAILFDKVVVVPAFPESVTDGDVKWNKKVGDQVAVDEEIAEIETDKTAIPVNSPEAGTIEEIFVEDGKTVKAGDQLCKIKSG